MLGGPTAARAGEASAPVTGFGRHGTARVDSVDMPCPDCEGTDCRAPAQAITSALLTVTGQGACIPLANAVLSAIPDRWFTDGPDCSERPGTTAPGDVTGNLPRGRCAGRGPGRG